MKMDNESAEFTEYFWLHCVDEVPGTKTDRWLKMHLFIHTTYLSILAHESTDVNCFSTMWQVIHHHISSSRLIALCWQIYIRNSM